MIIESNSDHSSKSNSIPRVDSDHRVIIGVKAFCIVSHVPSKSESPRAIKIRVRVRVRVILFHITACERGRPKNILGTKKIIRGPTPLLKVQFDSSGPRADKSDSDHRVIIGVKAFCIMSHVPSKSESESESESDRFTSQRASAGAFFGRPHECAFFIIEVTLQTSASQSESQSDD